MIQKLVILGMLSISLFMNNNRTESYSLTIKAQRLENTEGSMIFALYNRDGSIPDKNYKNYYRKKSAKIISNKPEIEFNNLPQGTYAITILHDENNNGKIDTKFILPLPDEGVGFSNYDDFGLSNRPNFKNASFNLIKDTTIVVNVIYK